MSAYSEHIYKNQADDIRIKIFKQISEWNVDVFFRNTSGTGCDRTLTYSDEYADLLRTKKDALNWASKKYGPLKKIYPEVDVTNGWGK